MEERTRMKEKINNLSVYSFHRGENYRVYNYLGAHIEENNFVFRTFAPNAVAVYLVGDFNEWDESMPLVRISDGGVWEYVDSASRVSIGASYKYKIVSESGEHYRGDPYAVAWSSANEMMSLALCQSKYCWRDESWLSYRKRTVAKNGFYSLPMNVYELHLGAWKRREDGSYLGYPELAREISTYVKQMGYTHIELLPIMEHTEDSLWGYGAYGFYAPTSRYGSPDDFRAFVDVMHEAGVGVILDFPIAHFPKDAGTLYEYDGKPLYEKVVVGDQMQSVRLFDLERAEVESFIISSASYWIEEYHIDGLRIPSLTAMLYPGGKGSAGEWKSYDGEDALSVEAVAFLRRLNTHVKDNYPDVIMIAEESSAYANVTSFENGGLGFDMRWNVGWAHDSLNYMAKDPIYRKYHHENMTFSLTYQFSEQYILPVSHDEVAVNKRSLIDKASGEYWDKFASVRAYMAYMMTHPGKKLSFMGNEIAQFCGFDVNKPTEWFLLDYDMHAKLQLYVSQLNHFYLKNPALWQNDKDWNGFSWIDADNRDHSILSYRRMSGSDELIVVLNFTPVRRDAELLGVPCGGFYREVFNSDSVCFGGSGAVNEGDIRTSGKPVNRLPYSIKLTVPPLGVTILRCVSKNETSEKHRRI